MVLYLFSDLSLVLSGQNLKIWFQSTGMESFRVLEALHRLAEEDVILNSGILDPRLLGDVRHFTLRV